METTHGDRRPTFTIYFCLKPYSDGEICIWNDELGLDSLLYTASRRRAITVFVDKNRNYIRRVVTHYLQSGGMFVHDSSSLLL